MSLNVTLPDGRVLVNATEPEALADGADQAAVDDAANLAQTISDRAVARGEIARTAGDTLSVLGTTADVAAFGMIAVACMQTAMAGASTFAEFKTAFESALASAWGPSDPNAMSAQLLAGIADGSVRVPALEKDGVEMMGEIEARSTAVAVALSS